MFRFFQSASNNWRLGPKNILAIGIASIAGIYSANAQLGNYTFASSQSTYVPITGGQTPALTAGDLDEGYVAGIPLGFEFIYNGVIYTTISFSTNGFATLGSGLTVPAFTNNLSTFGTRPILAPLWDDLEMDLPFRYQVLGTPGNREFVVEWPAVYFNWLASMPGLGFQLRLREQDMSIAFHYNPLSTTINSPTASIGITSTGIGATNYMSVNTTGGWANPTVSTTSEQTNNNSLPDAGRLLTFTPAPAVLNQPINPAFSGVTINAMQVSWEDNSTNELGFAVFVSTDGINYTLASNVPSTTTAQTGTTYSLSLSNLIPGTTYQFLIFALSEGSTSAALAATQATLSPTICGTFTVGPGGNYPSLTAAFLDVNQNGLQCGSVLELLPAYSSSVETFPLRTPNIGNSPSLTLTVRPQSGATALEINSLADTLLISDNSRYIRWDGRPGGIGSASELRLTATGTAPLVVIRNDASHNTFQHLTFAASTGLTSQGVVTFGASPNGTGINNTLITQCNFEPGVSGSPVNFIYGVSSNGALTQNQITNSTFRDNWNPSGNSYGIFLGTGTSNWTLEGNSFYATQSRTASTGTSPSAAIFINNSSTGTGFTIRNNFIGGTAPQAASGPMTVTGTASYRYVAIHFQGSNSAPSLIENNTISNLAISSSNTTASGFGALCGIYCASGNVDIVGNTIGSATQANSVVLNNTNNGSLNVGISTLGTGSNYRIVGNTIASLRGQGTTGTITSNVTGMLHTGSGNVLDSLNTIGSMTAGCGLSVAAATGTGVAIVSGIQNSATGDIILRNNIIQNLDNSSASTSTSSQLRGIASTSGRNQITGNQISALSTAIGNTSALGASAAMIGIQMSSTTAFPHVISGNTISDLRQLHAGNATRGIGMQVTGPTGETSRIEKNRIQFIGGATTSTTSEICGIVQTGGRYRIVNNMVLVGVDPTGSAYQNGSQYSAMVKTSNVSTTFLHNTFHVAGTSVAAGGNSHAYRRTVALTGTNLDTLRNNIFSNTRTNASTGGNHFALFISSAVNSFNRTNNLYSAGGTHLSSVSTVVYPSLAAHQNATGLDLTSYEVLPPYQSATSLFLSGFSSTPLESGGEDVGVYTDITGDVRPGPQGSVNGGGYGFDIGADEWDGVPGSDVGITALITPSPTACNSLSTLVRFELTNFTGASIDLSINPVTVTSQVSGPNPQVFAPVTLNSGILPANGTLGIDVALAYDMSLPGLYSFSGRSSSASDLNVSNDSLAPVQITSGPATIIASILTVCGGDNVQLQMLTGSGTLQWQSFNNGNGLWENIAGEIQPTLSVNPSDTTQYRLVTCSTQNSNIITVNAVAITTPTVAPISYCGSGVVQLIATNSNSPIRWFDAASGGNQLGIGDTLSVNVSGSVTNYAQAFVTNSGPTSIGPLDNTIGSGGGSTGQFWTIFDVFEATTLLSVDIYPTATGTAILELQNAAQQTLQTISIPITTADLNQAMTVTLNWPLPIGNGYLFGLGAGSSALYRNSSGASYPYTVPGIMSITGNTIIPSNWYYGYNWRIAGICASPLVPGVITAVPSDSIVISSSAPTNSACQGDSLTLSASSANSGYVYSWSSNSGQLQATGANAVFAPSANGTVVVSAVDGNNCNAIDSVFIQSLTVPVAQVTPTTSGLCIGDAIPLQLNNLSDTVQTGTGIGSNTSSTYPTPFGTFYEGLRLQMLVTAAELQAGGISAGNLTELAFNTTNLNSVSPMNNFTIHLSATSVTALTSWQPTGTQVFTTAQLSLNSTGWNFHTFQTPFVWDGVSNILVEVCFQNPLNVWTNNASVQNSTMPFTASIWYREDGITNICNITSVTGNNSTRPNMRFSWAPQETISWTPSIGLSATNTLATVANPTSSTNYVATRTFANGCSASDTAQITVNSLPIVNLGNDTAFCAGSPFAAVLDAQNPGATYQWQDNSALQTFTATQAGTYTVVVTDVNSCSSSDTLLVSQNPLPVVTLGNDTAYCIGTPFSLTLNAQNPGASYQWQDNSTGQTFAVTGAGQFNVLVTDANSCQNSDTLVVIENALPVVNLGTDTSICGNVAVNILLDAQNHGSTFVWQDNSGNQTFSATQFGTYSVLVTDGNGCSASDTLQINALPFPSVSITETQVGPGVTELDATPGFNSYLWNTGANTPGIQISQTGTYSVQVTDGNGCSASDSINVTSILGIQSGVFTGLTYWPNPTREVLNLNASGLNSVAVTIQVLSLDGRTLHTQRKIPVQGSLDAQINMTDFSSGTYLVRISQGEHYETLRIVRIH